MKVKLCRESFEDMFKEMEELTGCKNPIVETFNQLWGSTCLGYMGIGGQAFTEATSVILIDELNDIVLVYLGTNKLAYAIQHPTRDFWMDVEKGQLLSVYEFTSIYKDRYGKNIKDELTRKEFFK